MNGEMYGTYWNGTLERRKSKLKDNQRKNKSGVAI